MLLRRPSPNIRGRLPWDRAWFFFSKFFFHLLSYKMMSKIRFHIQKTMKFYDISSFFDKNQVLIHKSVFSKKNFFSFFFKKNFFGKNWFVKKYLAFIKNWWYIIKLHSLVYMKTYFWHHFMTYKMKKKFLKKKIRKKIFLKKNLICEKVTSTSQ